MLKNILMLTPEYPADDLEKEFTPVVHFFTKEWVKMGYRVIVINTPANFPSIMYKMAKPFRRRLESMMGINIRMYPLSDREFTLDGVQVKRQPVHKAKPHGLLSAKEIRRSVDGIISYCENEKFAPDIIIAHWTNPAIDLMLPLKKHYQVPIAMTMHDDGYDFRRIYKNRVGEILSEMDLWGFRNYPMKRDFEKAYGKCAKSYMCFSGVPEEFIQEAEPKDFSAIRNILYVGLLMKRKHSLELVKALHKSDICDYQLDIVGEGNEKNSIEAYIEQNPELGENVHLLGRLPRTEVGKKMQEAQVFCMISEGEAFGLVYIEAMAAGCITIASRNEGFDGIIEDGVNGFLCGAGDVDELASIFNKIKKMKPEELAAISKKAIATARNMTDKKVAEAYIHDIEKLLDSKD